MFHLIREGNVSRKTHAKLTTFWGNRIHIDSTYKIYHHIAQLSNIKPNIFDCCINSCCAFMGSEYESAMSCPYCHESRFDERNRSRNTFEYIPLMSRIQSMFLNTTLIEKMRYRSSFDSNSSTYDDVFSGSLTSVSLLSMSSSMEPLILTYSLTTLVTLLSESSQMDSKFSNVVLMPPAGLSLPSTLTCHPLNKHISTMSSPSSSFLALDLLATCPCSSDL